MIRYHDEAWSELIFTHFQYKIERRDAQWVDVMLQVQVAESTPLPDDVVGFSILAICTHRGDPIQFVTLEDDCDSEYQLTESEQEQLQTYIRSATIQAAIITAVGDENRR
ncbi:MAG: hypothetical protein P0Y55_07375 [Candidatus Cohnella colombiensis]|uniref:Uncharacterized protein n=1 Tax=Candidatus Cohnella colombiensis TaxID=3121368 RepID=A0AA95F1B9_9BACL|nr:MAG: hypothetical protein P0Y55_07375 [Cohnella sp.]